LKRILLAKAGREGTEDARDRRLRRRRRPGTYNNQKFPAVRRLKKSA